MAGASLSNYNLKRMIPRLVVAVILVNISYYVCLLAVDLSNVLGWGSYSLFSGLKESIEFSGSNGNDGPWEKVMAGILAAGLAGAGVAMALSIPVILFSILALVLIVFILMARQALIVLLIVIAPLAFVAYLLPNTEKFFKKWYEIFFAMLIVFPIVGLIFGASDLASQIVTTSLSSGDEGEWQQVVGLAILALPLFAVPAILKGSLSSLGQIGAKLQRSADKAQGAAAGAGKKQMRGSYDRSLPGRFMRHRGVESEKRSNKIAAGAYKGIRPISRLRSIGNEKLNNSRLSGRFGSNEAARGQALADKEQEEEAGRQMSFLTNDEDMTNERLHAIVNDGKQSTERRGAAAKRLAENGTDTDVQKLLTNLGNSDNSDTAFIQKYAGQDIAKRGLFGLGDSDRARLMDGKFGGTRNVVNDKGEALNENGEVAQEGETIAQKQYNYEGAFTDRIGTHMNEDKLAGLSKDELGVMAKQKRDGQLTAHQTGVIRSSDQAIKDNGNRSNLAPAKQKVVDGVIGGSPTLTQPGSTPSGGGGPGPSGGGGSGSAPAPSGAGPTPQPQQPTPTGANPQPQPQAPPNSPPTGSNNRLDIDHGSQSAPTSASRNGENYSANESGILTPDSPREPRESRPRDGGYFSGPTQPPGSDNS